MRFTARLALTLSTIVFLVQLFSLGIEEYSLQSNRSKTVEKQIADVSRREISIGMNFFCLFTQSSLATIVHHDAHAEFFISILFEDEDGKTQAEGRLDQFYAKIQQESKKWHTLSLWGADGSLLLGIRHGERIYDDIEPVTTPEGKHQRFSIYSETPAVIIHSV